MSTLMKVGVGIALVVAVLVTGFYIFFQMTFPKIGPAEKITVQSTPEMIERGEYLATHVALCIDCHSKRDWQYFGGPLVPGTEGQGGEPFTESMGLPGNIYSKNITPIGIGSWTDGEVIRAITEGVSRDGTALFPVMPYPAYRTMDKKDLHAIVAYIRTLDPIDNPDIPERELDFPMNLIVQTIPKESNLEPRPAREDTVAYGKYLTQIAACTDCHTPMEKGKFVEEMYMAGGRTFQFPNGSIVRSMNITPDPNTGIGQWTKDIFITKFKSYAPPEGTRQKVPEEGVNTIMPWSMYAGMTEEDLGAIFEYLKTIQPIENQVTRYTLVE